MRVLMVSPGFFPIKGGTEVIISDLTLKLNKIGVKTDILTFNMDEKWKPKWKGETKSLNDFQVYRVPGLNWYPFAHTDRITMGINLIPGRFHNIIKKYDILHFHEDFSFPVFAYFVKRAKIFHLHGFDIHGYGVDFFKKYFPMKFILRNIADIYICLTGKMGKHLIELGISKQRIRHVPNGVDTKIFSPRGQKIENLILFVGRISFQKGLHILLKSLIYLKNSVRLVIIGPLDAKSEYGQKILTMIKRENEKGKNEVIYLGEMSREEIIEWYRKASIFVSPSVRQEAFGVVNLEALSCETPVIATNLGGIPEVVRHNKNGLLVPPNDSIKLAEALQYLLDNEKIRKIFGKAGRKWVLENFSLDIIVRRLWKIYDELL